MSFYVLLCSNFKYAHKNPTCECWNYYLHANTCWINILVLNKISNENRKSSDLCPLELLSTADSRSPRFDRLEICFCIFNNFFCTDMCPNCSLTYFCNCLLEYLYYISTQRVLWIISNQVLTRKIAATTRFGSNKAKECLYFLINF